MKSPAPGGGTSRVEVVHIHAGGLWVAVDDVEYFLPFDQYPWFRDARVADILNVELHHDRHLHWPALDVDLSVDMLANPSAYPLIAR
ncbi:MAG: DUF2442 domain-containing protein [Phycisphaeraceae bacterium]